jgi:hypothetical protein
MALAYYYHTLLALNQMAHLILWQINKTTFLVVTKEAVKRGEHGVKRWSYET